MILKKKQSQIYPSTGCKLESEGDGIGLRCACDESAATAAVTGECGLILTGGAVEGTLEPA